MPQLPEHAWEYQIGVLRRWIESMEKMQRRLNAFSIGVGWLTFAALVTAMLLMEHAHV